MGTVYVRASRRAKAYVRTLATTSRRLKSSNISTKRYSELSKLYTKLHLKVHKGRFVKQNLRRLGR